MNSDDSALFFAYTPPEITAFLIEADEVGFQRKTLLRFYKRGDWTGVRRCHLLLQSAAARLNGAWPAANEAFTTWRRE